MTTLNFLYRAEDIVHQLSRRARELAEIAEKISDGPGSRLVSTNAKLQGEKLAELQRELQSAIGTLPAPEAWKAQFVPGVRFTTLPGRVVEFLVANEAGERKPLSFGKLEEEFGSGARKAISRARQQIRSGSGTVKIECSNGQVWTAVDSTVRCKITKR